MLHPTTAVPSQQPPRSRPILSDDKTTEALRALRERYQATVANTVAAFRRLAAQLTTTPGAFEVVEMLRRELHRVHGTAGSYGFLEASKLAARFEDLAIQWAADPALDRERRGSIAERFANELEALLGAGSGASSTAPPSVVTGSSSEPGPSPAASRPDQASAPPVASVIPAAPAPPAGSETPDLIIVEDDPALADMLRYALGTAGFSFRHYATGPDALAALLALDTGGRRPVILLDVDLPGLDGFSLHERLRVERPGVYNTVFFTARGGEAEQLRAYRAGAIDYLSKPVSLRILMAKIPTWLDRSWDRR